MPLRVLRFNEGDFTLSVLDQSKLPFKEIFNNYKDAYEIVLAIKEQKIRGAVLLGIVTAYAFALETYRNRNYLYEKFLLQLKLLGKELTNIQPLNSNIVYIINRLLKFVEKKHQEVGVEDMYKEILQEARNIENEEIQNCNRIALNGLPVIKSGYSILTYSNSGILFTGGIGTAQGIIYKSYGRYNGNIKIYIPETRPLFEGLKHTCWEFSKMRMQFISICDNSAAYLFSNKMIDICLVGAEKVTKDGSIIGRIGTYNLAVLCNKHVVPFVVAFPSSSIGLDDNKYVTEFIRPEDPIDVFKVVFNGNNKVPKNYTALNYIYDITPSNLVTFYVNERGIYKDFKKLLNDIKKENSKSLKVTAAEGKV